MNVWKQNCSRVFFSFRVSVGSVCVPTHLPPPICSYLVLFMKRSLFVFSFPSLTGHQWLVLQRVGMGEGLDVGGVDRLLFFFIKPSLTVVVEGTFTHTDTRTHARGRGFFWGAWLRAERGPPPRRFNGRVGVSPCGGSPGLPATPRYLNKRRFGVGVVSFVFFYCSNKKKR